MSEDIEMAFEFDAPPEKIWRALSLPDYRERWLPAADLADAEPVAHIEGTCVSYRMRDSLPPHEESLVTFSVAANGRGGTRLEISQRLIAAPANANDETMMRAA